MRTTTVIILFILSIFSLSTFRGGLHAQGLFDKPEKSETAQGIRASILPDNRSVYLLWEPSDKEAEVIIARSSSRIDTPEKLYVADSLGRFSAKSKTAISNYYDYNLSPGTYYYAVVPVQDVRNRRVKLIPNQNYTIEPIIIEKSTGQRGDSKVVMENSGQSKSVGAIVLKAENNNIRVNWVPPWNAVPGKTIYSIYKSTSPLATMEEMKKADKLAELPHPINSYVDQNIEKSQTLFYGVSVKDENTEEVLPLEKGKSFVRIFFIKDKDGRSEAVRDTEPTEMSKGNMSSAMTVLGFGYERIEKGAVLKWIPPKDADATTQYTLYASTGTFEGGANAFVGGSVLKVGTLSHPKTSLKIKEIKPVDSLYFAITTKKAGRPENFDLTEGVSFFRYLFDRNLIPTEVASSDTNAGKSESSVTSDSKKDSTTDPSDTPTLGKKDEDTEKSDTKATKSSTSDSGIDGDFLDIEIDVRDSQKLDRILKATYAQKKYDLAVLSLENYAKKEKDSKLRGKAYFYAGISRYRRGEYRLALNHFLKQETSDFNTQRTLFWKNQTLAKLGRGR
ncbi:MAG: tetratricopeptide repeat protein [Leptospira sp.]|nr:tetratricopeptide repeat protein [Leptospira sp.]